MNVTHATKSCDEEEYYRPVFVSPNTKDSKATACEKKIKPNSKIDKRQAQKAMLTALEDLFVQLRKLQVTSDMRKSFNERSQTPDNRT
jgi:hypothetical protein